MQVKHFTYSNLIKYLSQIALKITFIVILQVILLMMFLMVIILQYWLMGKQEVEKRILCLENKKLNR